MLPSHSSRSDIMGIQQISILYNILLKTSSLFISSGPCPWWKADFWSVEPKASTYAASFLCQSEWRYGSREECSSITSYFFGRLYCEWRVAISVGHEFNIHALSWETDPMGHFLSCIRMLDIPAHSLTLISGVEIPGRFISTTFIIYGHYQGWQVYSIYIVITASSNLLHSYSDVLFLVCCFATL